MRAHPLKGALAAHWLERAAAEAGVAVAFRGLVPRLAALGAGPVVLELGAKAIDDEERHSGLCVEVASRYAGRELAPPPPRGGALPDFGTGDEALECALLVLGMCCINESIACEWLRACFTAATDAEAAQLHREHLKDEIDHARLGWAHFASRVVTPALKEVLRTQWSEKVLAANLAEWKKPDAHLPPEGVPALGHLSHEATIAAVDLAVRDVVRPGFARVGL